MKVEGSVALVTGANRGIGRAIAEELLSRRAAKVYAAVRDTRSIDDSRLTPVAFDVTDPERVAEVARELTDVTIVVNNAGIERPATALDATLGDARAELETNYLGLVSTMQAFAPTLAANGGGAFINMLSVTSWIGVSALATYSASKSAAWGYTNAARSTLHAQGTQVVAVHAGFVDTDSTAWVDVEKVAPATVATSALDALEAGAPEALADERTRGVKASLHDDLALLYPELQANSGDVRG